MENMLFIPKSSSKKGVIKYALADADTAGGILGVPNPTGRNVIVTQFWLNVTTVATAACTVDAGIAADATTSNNELVDGQDVNSAAGLFAGNAGIFWDSDEFLTISMATGAAADLVGHVYVEVMLV